MPRGKRAKRTAISKLHIDDECLDGGESDLTYHEKVSKADADIYCYNHFKFKNPERVGVFSYCLMADELMIIPDTMGIEHYAHGGYEYGFALEGENEYFQDDFEKCISMYNPSSKDGDDELTSLG